MPGIKRSDGTDRCDLHRAEARNQHAVERRPVVQARGFRMTVGVVPAAAMGDCRHISESGQRQALASSASFVTVFQFRVVAATPSCFSKKALLSFVLP